MGPAIASDTGEPGERFAFSVEWLPIASSASNSYMLNGTYGYILDPYAIGGRTVVESSLFTKYCIRRVTFTYIPIVATTVAGNMIISVAEDPSEKAASLPATVTTASISELIPSKEMPVNMPSKNFMTYSYGGKFLWYIDTTSSEDVRWTGQIAVFAVGAGVTASNTFGKLLIEGIIDFYAPNNVSSPPSETVALNNWIKVRSGARILKSIATLKAELALRKQFNMFAYQKFISSFATNCVANEERKLGTTPALPSAVGYVALAGYNSSVPYPLQTAVSSADSTALYSTSLGLAIDDVSLVPKQIAGIALTTSGSLSSFVAPVQAGAHLSSDQKTLVADSSVAPAPCQNFAYDIRSNTILPISAYRMNSSGSGASLCAQNSMTTFYAQNGTDINYAQLGYGPLPTANWCSIGGNWIPQHGHPCTDNTNACSLDVTANYIVSGGSASHVSSSIDDGLLPTSVLGYDTNSALHSAKCSTSGALYVDSTYLALTTESTGSSSSADEKRGDKKETSKKDDFVLVKRSSLRPGS